MNVNKAASLLTTTVHSQHPPLLSAPCSGIVNSTTLHIFPSDMQKKKPTPFCFSSVSQLFFFFWYLDIW